MKEDSKSTISNSSGDRIFQMKSDGLTNEDSFNQGISGSLFSSSRVGR
jgi:hypothetical protein